MVHPTLEHRIAGAAALWKWQRVIKSLAIVVSFLALVALAVGGLALLGWVTTPLVVVAIGFSIVLAVLFLLVMLISTVDKRLDRQWLAAEVERNHVSLMDRFNTVLELDRRPHDVSATMYRDAIEKQAATILRKAPDRSPFSWYVIKWHVLIAALLFVSTVWFYSHFQPLSLLAEEAAPAEPEEAADGPLAIPEIPSEDPLATALADDEATGPWGEVRISQPGRDLRVTRHEEIPLLIEAAADRPLSDAFWLTAINLADETAHDLPEFEDPRYAVFQPKLQPEALGLRDWDFVYYRAAAVASDNVQYDSNTFFVEVIPSRDELDELPDDAYQQLEEITGLIQQQQEVIRQTEQISDAGDPQQARRMDALAQQENRISKSAEYLQVALGDRLGPDVTKSMAETIDQARVALQDAETALGEHERSAATKPEQTALLRLADARRKLADLVRDHPDAFEESALAAIDEARIRAATPADPEFAQLLEELAREKSETASAAEQLQALAADQQQLADQASRQRPENLPPLAATQRAIEQQLETLRETHPSAFRDLTALSAETSAALDRAGKRLEQGSSAAPTATQQAEQRLSQLAREMDRRHLAHELAEGQTLEDRLEANLQAYREIFYQPEQIDADGLQETTGQTDQLLDELQQLASTPAPQDDQSTDGENKGDEQDANGTADNDEPRPSSDISEPASGFPELAKNLSPDVADQIRSQCDGLNRAATAAERTALAKGIGTSLKKLSDSLAKDLAQQGTRLDQQQLASQMEQMQRRSEGLKNARQFVQQAIARQRSIERDAYSDRNRQGTYQSLAEKQLSLEQELAKTMDQNPNPFQQAAGQCQAASDAMQQSAQSLRSRGDQAPQLANAAAEQLQKLDQALEQQQRHSEISEKQQVREMLERMSERLDNFAKNPDKVTAQQKQQTAGQCKSVGSQACQMAGQSAGSSGSSGSSGGGQQGQPPRGSTPSQGSPSNTAGQTPGPGAAGDREQQLNEASDRLAEAEGAQETSSAARDLQQQLRSLAAELGGRQPGGTQPGGTQPGGTQPGGTQAGASRLGQQSPGGDPSAGNQPGGRQTPGQSGQAGSPSRGGAEDALRPGGAQAIDRGLAQLESAARRSEQGNLTDEAGQSLRRGGIADLIAGISSQYGHNESGRAVVRKLSEQMAEPSQSVDMKTLQSLRQQIQSLQQDLAMQPENVSEAGPTTYVDPTRFPSDYRESIQKYYETLSEDR